MKKNLWLKLGLIGGLCLSVFATIPEAEAQTVIVSQTLLRGSTVYNADCGGNKRGYQYIYCPSGYRPHGVVYDDFHRGPSKGDSVDSLSLICRSVSSGNILMASDFTNMPIKLQCDKTEVMSGIVYKDRKGRDEADGFAPVCLHPKTGRTRTLYNPDIAGGRPGVQISAPLKKKMIGIATKDMDDGNKDELDCAMPIYADRW